MKQLTYNELLDAFDDSMRETVASKVAPEGVLGMVLYYNQQLDSSRLGEMTGLIFGPGLTGKTMDHLIACYPRLGDLPSNFKYPSAYFAKEPAHV